MGGERVLNFVLFFPSLACWSLIVSLLKSFNRSRTALWDHYIMCRSHVYTYLRIYNIETDNEIRKKKITMVTVRVCAATQMSAILEYFIAFWI